jgi:branched-chain amino acid transport system permease protein
MTAFVIQALNGLSYASTLFLMAAGLTLIFGVTRIVNFAHGSFFMLGALISAHALGDWFSAWAESPWLYTLAMVLAAVAAAVVGGVAERLLLRHLYGVPELYQLVATFGLGLAMHDAMRWMLGPEEVFAPRFPGLKGAWELGDAYFPEYQIVLIGLGPLVWAGLWLFLHRSTIGQRLRAATQDPDMLRALGVDPQPLMLMAVVLGCFLAGLGGALQIPREPANLQMDTNIVVETFVVVVTGGLGSLRGAFLAALLVGQVHAFGTSLFPQSTLVLVFLTMALVLVFFPTGLGGKPLAPPAQELGLQFACVPRSRRSFYATLILLGLGLLLARAAGAYWESLAVDAMILVLFGISLQAMMALGGLVSFGHAAFFGVGAYAAALSHQNWGWNLPAALLAGSVLAMVLGTVAGAMLIRSTGVYLAMLSLALAQVLWAAASQWVGMTGGDNGVIGLRLLEDADRGRFFLGLLVLTLGSVLALRRFAHSGLGLALQAARDAPVRAAASGLSPVQIQYRVLVGCAGLAGLAGALFAAHRGTVFPSVLSVSTSLDVLLVLLLGGMHQLWGTLAGAAVLVWAAAELGRGFDYWRGVLGVMVMVIMVAAPHGLLGLRLWGAERDT